MALAGAPVVMEGVGGADTVALPLVAGADGEALAVGVGVGVALAVGEPDTVPLPEAEGLPLGVPEEEAPGDAVWLPVPEFEGASEAVGEGEALCVGLSVPAPLLLPLGVLERAPLRVPLGVPDWDGVTEGVPLAEAPSVGVASTRSASWVPARNWAASRRMAIRSRLSRSVSM